MDKALIDFAITEGEKLVVVEAQRNSLLNQLTDSQIQVTKLRNIVDELNAQLSDKPEEKAEAA